MHWPLRGPWPHGAFSVLQSGIWSGLQGMFDSARPLRGLWLRLCVGASASRRACRESTHRRRPTLSPRSQGRLKYISRLQTYLLEGIMPSRASERAIIQQALLGHPPPVGHPGHGPPRLCDIPGLQLEAGGPPRVSQVRPLALSGPVSLPPPWKLGGGLKF